MVGSRPDVLFRVAGSSGFLQWRIGSIIFRMSQTFGMELHREHAQTPHREPVRYLVLIESGGYRVARLLSSRYDLLTTIDAAVEEVGSMIAGLVPQTGALGAEWDHALAGHSADERAAAKIYALAI